MIRLAPISVHKWFLVFVILLVGQFAFAESYDKLLFDAVRYGNTPEKRAAKEKARKEIFDHKADSLRYVMTQICVENVMVQVLAQELVEGMKPEDATPVLAEFLNADKPKIRKMAAFFLSLHDTPHYADRVTPLLSNDETAGAAMRALGKWHVKAAVTNIFPFLKNEKEGRRIAAVNALRDIGDPAAIPYLMPLLNDPIFTVREVAARALSTLGPDAEKALLAALPDAQGLLRLYLIRTLGVMESRRAVGSLRRCLKDPDPVVRTYAQKALAQIGAD